MPRRIKVISHLQPRRFLDVPIEVTFDKLPAYEKKPPCPDRWIWEGQTYQVTEILAEWTDFSRRGRFARNMTPGHAALASRRGSWGVGRFYFRVRTNTGQIFDLYYDRAPQDANHRKGNWFLFRELIEK